MESNTKECPYCGQEIKAVAKKCKHCGEWLEEPQKNSGGNETTVRILQDFEEDIKRAQKKKKILFFAGGFIILGLIIWLVIAYNQKNVNERRSQEQYVEQDATTSSLYNEMHSKIVNSRYRILRADGQKIWFVWPADDGGYAKTMHVYDSNTNQITDVNLNRTYYNEVGEGDEWIVIDDIEHRNGKITVIMRNTQARYRWAIEVHQYNCDSNQWTELDGGCGNAEFINNRTAVRVCDYDCINPEECMANHEYVERYETFQL